VNQHYYKEVLLRLWEKVRRQRSQVFQSGRWLLHHDNAPARTALSIQEFLAEKKIPVVPHPPYSSDLAPCDFFLFPRMKMKLKGRRFDDADTIKMNTTRELNMLSREDSSDVSRGGRNVGTSAYYQQGTTLKGTISV
jgi:hypothetical protein